MSSLLRFSASGSRALLGSSGILLFSLLRPSPAASFCSNANPSTPSSSPRTFANELGALKKTEKEMRERWILDEDNWRKLPSRCWPEKQPSSSDIPALQSEISTCGTSETAAAAAATGGSVIIPASCLRARFELATALIFNGEEPAQGFALVSELAAKGSADGICLAGVCHIEGYGTPVDLEKGVEFLQKGVALGHGQSHYELATLYYTGAAASVLPEDDEKALYHFEKAAEISNFSYALFMVADILLERVKSVKDCDEQVDVVAARALRLLYAAADRGHRFARQEIISLLEQRHRLTREAGKE